MTQLTDNKPLISIVMSFYNAESTLLQAIKSVFMQTYDNWELVLLDDGSTDNSLSLARSVIDKRVRVVSDGLNKGLAPRKNELSGLALGEFIAFLDADDLIHPTKLEKQLAVFLQNPSIDLVSSGLASMDANFRLIGVRSLEPLDVNPMTVLKTGSIVHATIMARRAWFLNNPYREGYHRAEDRELFLRVLPQTQFEKVCEPLYFYMESGVQSADKLLSSYQTERKTILEYAPSYVGITKTMYLWSRSLMKSLVVMGLSGVGQLNLLASRRIGTEQSATIESLQTDIDRILAFSLAS